EPTEEPTPEPGPPTANISLASASVSDDAVVLDIDGLPPERVVVDVKLSSKSGQTTFEVQNSDCSVSAGDPLHAACVSGGGGGAAVMLLAPSRFQAVIPLAFPATLTSDELTVTISIAGYDDPSAANNRATFTFTPTPTTTTPPPTPTADLQLALAKDDDTHVTATVNGLPVDGATLVFDVVAEAGASLSGAPDGCTIAETKVRCEDVTGPFAGSFTFAYDPSIAPVDVTLSVAAEGVIETAPVDNVASVSLGTAPPPTADIAVTVDDNQLGQGTGRFRLTVTGLPTGDGPTKVRIETSTDNPQITLEDIPVGCAFVDGSTTVVECDPGGPTFSGVFDMDLQAIVGQETVGVTVTVSVPGNVDPDPSNNTKTFSLGAGGVIGLLGPLVGEGSALEPVGTLVEDLIDLL
ncbi:MAG TPA: hypothetical protein VLI04_11180, partial [Nocardioidaceae bacterium]|nr:hypothetical protein [Nocardioidaceae bacterium]